MRKCSNLMSLLESRVYKKRQTLAIVWEISDSNLETGRYCLKSGVSWTIWKSWQHCHCWADYEQICKKYPWFNLNPFSQCCSKSLVCGWILWWPIKMAFFGQSFYSPEKKGFRHYLLCMMSVNCEPSSGVWDKLIKSSTWQN